MMNSIDCPGWLRSIHHDGSEKYVSNLYPELGETIRLSLRVNADAPIERICLRTYPGGELALISMKPTRLETPAQWWEVDLTISEPRVHYSFMLQARDGVWCYSAAGPVNHETLFSTDFKIIAGYQAPSWIKESVFYQIFPDRFATTGLFTDFASKRSVLQPDGLIHCPWETAPPAGKENISYGGDLPGIMQHMDYLQDLGVSALYLNPVMTSLSNHKYNVADYYRVDPQFGGDEALIALRRALTDHGMRLLLDMVPNHCGFEHEWFQTAREDTDSPQARFFTFNDHPHEYATWMGFKSLPKLNYQSHELRRMMYEGPDAIFRYWLRSPYCADGWRVDVGNMLGRQGEIQLDTEVIQGIRRAVKETAPDAYLMAEEFFDASGHLQGDQWDGVMNYMGFTHPLWHWLCGFRRDALGSEGVIESSLPWPGEALAQGWQESIASIPWVLALQQFNVLGSHDTGRIRTRVKASDQLHRLAAIVQMTFPGIPSVYYGDEIGMVDLPGVASRGCMIWDEERWNQDLRKFYQRLIRLRRDSVILQRGGFQMLVIEQDTIVYQREAFDGRILTIAHRGAAPRAAAVLPVAHGGIPDGTLFEEIFTGERLSVRDGVLHLPEHAQGASVWQTVR